MTERAFRHNTDGLRPIPIANPPNPWATTEIEYFDGAPEVRLEVFADHTRHRYKMPARSLGRGFQFGSKFNGFRGFRHPCRILNVSSF